MPNIHLHQVCKQFDRGAGHAVDQLDLLINEGEFMCILGPSGCGKTTTLRMIAGLENVSSGKIVLGDTIVDSKEDGVFLSSEKRKLGLVFQSYALWPHMTVEKNIEFGLKLQKLDKKKRQDIIQSVMETLGIEKYRSRYPSQLSGGQQQRVALARMLAVQPNILLMDEPLSNLDARLRLEMRTELKRIHSTYNTTIVFVTHDQWEAMALATKIAVMKDGELQQVGTPNDIYDRPENRFVAEFVGTPPINIVELDQPSLCSELIKRYLENNLGNLEANCSVGIRPERIKITGLEDTPDIKVLNLKARLESILPTGGSWILELSIADHKIHINTQIPPSHVEGDTMNLSISPQDILLFNADGKRFDWPLINNHQISIPKPNNDELGVML
ncbi:ABC transporter ATP-binding protein [Vibrio inusitatus NBRC 102082]|uniref:ABC transporter ATP-binding protein n=1 Tax=Vibrio inusitatus NBRC 102082 TaxID=1219070 RepID=A0A4Y3I036_9VIBR|nr:ABC transporter ATP-binding protein [Vibrio inusitatus]GEA52222.1 ABC transporter ATP-binding protein [Vibrio inusitatus NBRC 102082]